MEIIQILEQAKAQVIAEREHKLETIRQDVIQNIAPKYQELDALKTEELNKITLSYQERKNALIEQHNKLLVALQEEEDANRIKVTELINSRKEDIFKTAFQDATCRIAAQYNKTIVKLDTQIADLKE